MTRSTDSRRWQKPLLNAAVGVTLALSGAVLRGLSDDRLPLTPGVVVEREIGGGETHSFQIHAIAGQLIYAHVDQRGADVRVTLIGPDERELALSDFPNANWGLEAIAVIAESSGEHTLRVTMLDAKATPAKYDVRLLALRGAAPVDRDRAAAETRVGNAERLRRQRTAAARSGAIAEYESALPFFEASGERYRQGLILNSVGLIYAQSGDMRSALLRYDRAIQLFHDLGDSRREGGAVNNAGGAYDVLGDLTKAHSYYQRALALFRSVGNRLEEANTLSNIGKLYADQAEWQKAIEYFREALPVNQAAGDRRREATVLANLGAAYYYLGEYDKARDRYFQALERQRATGEQTAQAVTLDDLGQVYLVQEQAHEALRYHQQALRLNRTSGNRRGEGLSLNYIGMSQQRLGDTAKALDALRQSVDLLRAAGDRRLEAMTLRDLGRVYADSGAPGKSLEYSGKALSGFRAIGDRNNEARTLLTIANAQRTLGNLAVARRNAEESLNLIEHVRAGAGAGETRASYFAARQDAYAFTIDLLMELHGGDPSAHLDAVALETSERSRARSLIEMLAESGNDVRQGVDPELLAREHELANLLNAKGARLLPLMGQETPQAATLKQEVRSLEAEYQELQAAIRKSSPHYAALTQPSPLKLKQIQDELLDPDSLLLEYALGQKRSYLWTVSKTGFHSWVLPAREQIEAQVARVYELLTARSVNKRMETPAERRKRIAQADSALPEAARRLSDMILGPAASTLAGKLLILVPDGALQRLPFTMLSLPGSQEPLVASHEIVVLPSASALWVLRNELRDRKPAPKMLAVFADPVFSAADPRTAGDKAIANSATPEFSRILTHLADPGEGASAGPKIPRLSFTLQEAERILSVAPDRSNFRAVGYEASRAAATSGKLSEYRYVHFATHGFLDTERPSLSALVLSQINGKQQPQDGFLRVNDIYNIKLSAELVVLSACQTGLGKEVKGEGLMGLTRAFLYAGAPRVVVSLWNVNDRATADLMANFYRRMLREGKRPAAALREAQFEMRKQKRWESPYYWAAFVQHGEWK